MHVAGGGSTTGLERGQGGGEGSPLFEHLLERAPHADLDEGEILVGAAAEAAALAASPRLVAVDPLHREDLLGRERLVHLRDIDLQHGGRVAGCARHSHGSPAGTACDID